ncbi:ABC transporter ATP-binding protein [Oceanobacillus neutriphilus]|uniref:Dipeptide/oligopeptide/nickel ABC transporter ATP-binding protein n=1 Tax=Oceanobacillus neutriphilus TaxID=531815 RepID=A0ABQ2NNW9_9BACI|nr:ABC transporter ATP-binding protein [Oceanobacillus neutriphilus]GGP07101.1 dipeptide/oligopeptide/nickel ABC transporter ATP-binding protein [Oceanobacillus neutriphilus]
MSNELLKIKNLSTSFRIGDEYYAAVDDVTLTLNKNEVLGIVGESGSGKSALAFSVMRLHTKAKIEGEVLLNNQDIVTMPKSKLDKIRGDEMAMIFQDPLTALNPLTPIGGQIEETLFLHNRKLGQQGRKKRAVELLDLVGIPNAERVFEQFPHELSGGMRQRVIIAIAIANDPKLLIADEPTTALDVTIQAQILDLIRELKEKIHAGIILITHDLGVVAEMADRVAVMYAGQIVEIASVEKLFENPLHPYTRSLLNSVPVEGQDTLHVIQGVVPSLKNLPREGCRFAARIPWVDASAHEENPTMHEVESGHFVRCTCHEHFYIPDQNEEKGEQSNGIS